MDAKNDYPVASKTIRENFYVDDLLLSMNTPEEITQVCRKVSSLLSKRGFELRKWRLNSLDVLRRLNVTKEENFEIHGSTRCKALVLQWESSSDVFCFTPRLEINPPLTKRKIISNASQIFDPLALISPCVIWIKIFYQKLWLSKSEWDDFT
ncbi:uncharacterized protein CDAR_231861 [Caerostris darwini]|uniref:Reverse transcriptase domain-containing protein n=1 Tax=Caerostris darwini TaxID=1538125 RepID=A0AAV4N4V5_9ARAC|nr:uncharacterized protein CDAR_231861 [Caerostris darwini]